LSSSKKGKIRRTNAEDREPVKKALTEPASKARLTQAKKVDMAQSLKKRRSPDFGEIYFQDNFSSNNIDYNIYTDFPPDMRERYGIEGGRLAIMAPRGQDLWGGVPLKRRAPLLLHEAPAGDYGIECVIDGTWGGVAQRINTQVGLFVFEDVENWLFFGFSHHSSQQGAGPQGGGLMITSTIGDNSKIRHQYDFPPMTRAKLGIERAGNYWRFYLRSGGSWKQIGSDVHGAFGNHMVGMGVKSFQYGGSPQKGYFDNFIIRTH
jgi:hypothetical protein